MSEDPKRTPSEWEKIDGIMILDPDGWRRKGDPSWDTPISYSEWRQRMSRSTCGPLRSQPSRSSLVETVNILNDPETMEAIDESLAE